MKVAGHSVIWNIRCSNFSVVVAQHRSENIQQWWNDRQTYNHVLLDPDLEPSSTRITLDLRMVSRDSFNKVVHYVYSGTFEVETGTNILEVLAISSYFGLQHLTEWCNIYLYNSLNINNTKRSDSLTLYLSYWLLYSY